MIETIFSFFAFFVLLLIEVDLILKKTNCKQNSVRLSSFGNSKIVFILLIAIVTFYIEPIIIDVREPGFEFIPK